MNLRRGRPTGARTGRLAFVVASRQAGGLVRPALTLRIIALVVVLTVSLQMESLSAVAACLPAVAICMLRARTAPAPAPAPASAPAPAVPSVQVRAQAETGAAADRRRARWVVVSWTDLLSALGVVAVAAWGTAELPASSRFLAVGAGAMLLAVASTRLCLDARWYRPDPRPRRLSRRLRALAGPLGMVACQAVALPAPWGPGERAIVVFLTLLPLANVSLTRDQDLTVARVVQMIRTEAQDGRQVVLDELHGSLSANLRLLEQAGHDLRATSPRLYELAVSANSRLRETLTLADPRLDSAAQPHTLGALVRTLTMAVGASGELTVRVDRLVDADRDLIRLVLNDVLRALLADGATRVQATVELERGWLHVTVDADSDSNTETDRSPLQARLAPLRQRLAVGGGSVLDQRTAHHRRLLARWPASAGTR